MMHIEADDVASAVQDALRGALERTITYRAQKLSAPFSANMEEFVGTAEAELNVLPFTEALREVLDNL